MQRAVVETITLDDRTPTGLAVGEGAVWVAHGMRGEVSRVDPQFNRVTNTIAVASPSSRTGAIAVGLGFVWAVFGDSTFARIDPVDLRHLFVGRRSLPSAVVVGNGAVWVANFGDSTVQRFNPATFEEGAVGRSPWVVDRGIAFGEGAVWVANTSDDSVTESIPSRARRARHVEVGVRPVALGPWRRAACRICEVNVCESNRPTLPMLANCGSKRKFVYWNGSTKSGSRGQARSHGSPGV